MGAKRQKDYQCVVVGEPVKVHLRTKTKAGWTSHGQLFVQCDQSECQYVDVNAPPCPLSVSMFAEEIRERDERARLRRETADY